MTISFADGTALSSAQVTEDKRIYSEPKKWELKITSDTDISSEELDRALTPTNISKITCEKNDGTVAEFSDYSYVDRVSKTHTDSGVALVIIIQKELAEDEA